MHYGLRQPYDIETKVPRISSKVPAVRREAAARCIEDAEVAPALGHLQRQGQPKEEVASTDPWLDFLFDLFVEML